MINGASLGNVIVPFLSQTGTLTPTSVFLMKLEQTPIIYLLKVVSYSVIATVKSTSDENSEEIEYSRGLYLPIPYIKYGNGT